MTSLTGQHGLTTQDPVRTSEESPNGNRIYRTHRTHTSVLRLANTTPNGSEPSP